MKKRKFHGLLAICLCLALSISTVSAYGQTAAPKAPANVKAISQGSTKIQLSWSKSQNAKTYQVYRYYSKTGQWKLARTTTASSAGFTGLAKNTTYKFKVRALAGTKKSSYSSVVSSKTGVETRISLNTSSRNMTQGDTYTLKASVTAKAPSKTVAWSSSNQSVATVSAAGKVKALKPGTATITAKAHNGATAAAKIQVIKNADLPPADGGQTPPDSQKPEVPNKPTDPSEPSVPSSGTYEQRYNEEMLRLVNQFRKSNGKSALTYNKAIQKAADLRAQEAIKRPDLSHKRYDKNGNLSSFSSVFSDLGLNIRYTKAGENLAWRGYQSSPETAAKSLFDQWKNSAGHRANMLDSGYTSMATAISYDKTGSGKYQYSAASVQLFIGQ